MPGNTPAPETPTLNPANRPEGGSLPDQPKPNPNPNPNFNPNPNPNPNGKADLSQSNLLGVNLEGADLAKVNLSGATFDVELWAPKGWLKGATLQNVDWKA